MSTKLSPLQKKYYGVVPGIVRDCLGELATEAAKTARMRQRMADAAKRRPSADLPFKEQAEEWAYLMDSDSKAVKFAEGNATAVDERRQVLLADLAAGEAFIEAQSRVMEKAKDLTNFVYLSRLANTIERVRRDYEHGWV